MIKVFFSWRDNPEKTAEECERHYREHHMKLAKQAYEGVDGFIAIAYNRVLNHTVHDFNQPASIPKAPEFDVFVEIWFESNEKLEKALQQPILIDMFNDHKNFMDVGTPANIKAYEVTEDVFVGKRLT